MKNPDPPLKSSDIWPPTHASTNVRLAIQDKQRLKEHAGEFVHVSCPACDADAGEPRFEKLGLHYVACPRCQTVYACPRPTPALLADYYRHAQKYVFWNSHIFPDSERCRRELIVRPRVDLLLEHCARLKIPTGTLVEVGAGFGTFCAEVMSRSIFHTILAVEPTPALAARCRERGITTIESPVEETHIPAADVVVCFETIEHLFSPLDLLRRAAEILSNGGLLFLSCPNMLGFDNLVLQERADTVGGEHINLFNPASLHLLLERCGMEVLLLDTPGRLDAEIVRNAFLEGLLSGKEHPFLHYLLVERWESAGRAFQDFLAAQGLSSHMRALARRPGP